MDEIQNITLLNQNLISIEELYRFTGYQDLRSVKRFCHEHAIPLIQVGKKFFYSRSHFDAMLEDRLRREETNCNPGRAFSDHEVAAVKGTELEGKKLRSDAAQRFLNKSHAKSTVKI